METFQSEQINELAAAIVKAQLALVPAAKDHVNPFFKSKYADLPTVWEASGPFRENGIAITQSPMDAPDEYIVLDTQLSHVSGQWMRSRLKMRVAKDDPQGYGSALTYARRYALGCMTGIVTEEDDDGNAASHRPVNEQLRAQKFTDHKQTAQAKIAELAKEMQEPARQCDGEEVRSSTPTGSSTDAAAPLHFSGVGTAQPTFLWRMGKWKDHDIGALPIDYLAWAVTNISRDDHRQAAADEIDRRQKQDHMNFEAQGN